MGYFIFTIFAGTTASTLYIALRADILRGIGIFDFTASIISVSDARRKKKDCQLLWVRCRLSSLFPDTSPSRLPVNVIGRHEHDASFSGGDTVQSVQQTAEG